MSARALSRALRRGQSKEGRFVETDPDSIRRLEGGEHSIAESVARTDDAIVQVMHFFCNWQLIRIFISIGLWDARPPT